MEWCERLSRERDLRRGEISGSDVFCDDGGRQNDPGGSGEVAGVLELWMWWMGKDPVEKV